VLAKRCRTRTDRARCWLVLAAVGCASLAHADESRVRVEIQGGDALERSAHLGVTVLVQLPAAGDVPLLLTPRVEGTAVEVVRGRLLRSDGKALDATHLRFEVPVVARSEGTAILRVDVSTYVCEPRCLPVGASASRVLHVR
jgi:hypothetical protein